MVVFDRMRLKVGLAGLSKRQVLPDPVFQIISGITMHMRDMNPDPDPSAFSFADPSGWQISFGRIFSGIITMKNTWEFLDLFVTVGAGRHGLQSDRIEVAHTMYKI